MEDIKKKQQQVGILEMKMKTSLILKQKTYLMGLITAKISWQRVGADRKDQITWIHGIETIQT